ncbi:MAG: hypothetical protein HY038_11035 [Nitrospirae bacterium]|nr:hypothetical protein [Nitrospirota bacterium]
MRTSIGEIMWSMRNCVIGTTVGFLIVLAGNRAFAAEPSETSPGGVALEATSWLLTIPYGAVEAAYALGGGVVGCLAWAVTGGNTEVAEAVWIPSMTGDYIVRPENLSGEKPLHFFGKTSNKHKS